MFDPNDFEDMAKERDTAPDGIIDASDYADDMKIITDILCDLDYDDMVSRMHAMMNIMNHMYDNNGEIDVERVNGVVISLSFHIITMLNTLEDDSRQEYFQFIKNDVISEIEKEASTLPYWDVDESNDG